MYGIQMERMTIDCMGGYGVRLLVGHQNKEVNDAIKEQKLIKYHYGS